MGQPDLGDIKIFADGADLEQMLALAQDPRVGGFTTNPTLMRQAGVGDYEAFARKVLDQIDDRPISFEVFADDGEEFERQARRIAGWGPNVVVKIPVTTTRGEPSDATLRRLSGEGIALNVTAVMTPAQVRRVAPALTESPGAIVSVFAGRIADTGRDPLPVMREALAALETHPQIELLWASPREVLNVVQAASIGCHIITVTPDLYKKIDGFGKDLDQFSLETVQMFHRDAHAAGYDL